jgi:mRNA-degrading endonuclease RelE of RelBE toxin-antitoxin system
MPNELPPIEIDLSPRFTRDLRDLSKHYRKLRSDLQPLIDQCLTHANYTRTDEVF